MYSATENRKIQKYAVRVKKKCEIKLFITERTGEKSNAHQIFEIFTKNCLKI